MRQLITLNLKRACSRTQLAHLWLAFAAARAKKPNERRYVLSATTDNPETPLEVWAVVDNDGGEEIATLLLPKEDD
jgi:hypothetical protein